MGNNYDHLNQAAHHWAMGEGLEAGKLIYENLPINSRPGWASGILKVVLDRSGYQSPLIDQVLICSENENMWNNGHQLFSSLRKATLNLDALRRSSGISADDELSASILSLAELVAKVIYNAANPLDEFDEDSGWWVAATLNGFVNHVWSDEQFSTAAWSALCRSE